MEGQKVYSEDIKIISDIGVTVIDIKTGKPQLAENVSQKEMEGLAGMIDDFVHGRKPPYPRLTPTWDASTFSTLA